MLLEYNELEISRTTSTSERTKILYDAQVMHHRFGGTYTSKKFTVLVSFLGNFWIFIVGDMNFTAECKRRILKNRKGNLKRQLQLVILVRINEF